MSDPNHVRETAQTNFLNNPQTQMVSEQTTPNAETRNTYNAEIDRLRKESNK